MSADAGVTAVYDRHTYDKEKRAALAKWARKLKEILTDEKQSEKTGKVVSISGGPF